MEKATIEKMKNIFGYKNDLAMPRLEKVLINAGIGRLSQQPNFEEKILPELVKGIAAISGQKPVPTKAKKSIAGFKTRTGQIVGLKVSLRRRRMEDFVNKLVRVVLPRLRDFRGLDQGSVDKSGNLNIGLRDYTVFPEINPEETKIDFGLEISIVTTAKNREEAIELYKILGIPFKK